MPPKKKSTAQKGNQHAAMTSWQTEQTMRRYNRPAGVDARSDRSRRSGGPTDRLGPSPGANKGVHACSQTHAHSNDRRGRRALTGGSVSHAGRAAAQRGV
eukprot:6982092-Prymnesium_polylepis.1